MSDMLSSIVMLSLVVVWSLAIALAILVPLTGALVRFRAHYNPKGLQLDPEGGVQPRTGPVITSFLAMLVRVYRIEGWQGLYKGLVPILLLAFVSIVYVSLSSVANLYYGSYIHPSLGVLASLGHTLLLMLICLPLTIIACRAITTPLKLPYNVNHSLRVLLTPAERRRPWILYKTPGLLVAQVLQITYAVLGLTSLKRLLLPELVHPALPPREDVSFVRLAIFFSIALTSTVVVTPLEVISVRLAIQGNNAVSESHSVSPEQEASAEEIVEYAGTDEDVVSLRTGREPYTGLMNCARSIVEEEGWSTLYRAWWLTMFGLAFS